MPEGIDFQLNCPVPIGQYTEVVMAHGGGGRLTNQLIERVFVPAFRNAALDQRHDGAVVELPGSRLAFTTDGYVVRPRFFPGGDIGSLAVNGTLNDLAMCGARPRWLSASFILEEGLPLEELQRIVQSMARTAAEGGVALVTGDTKVVDRGKGDGVYIATAGVGEIVAEQPIQPSRVKAGDAVIVSGDLGRHGIAIMSVREGLSFESEIASDCAALHEMVLSLLAAGIEVHCLRDLTRGGLASALNEIAVVAGVQVHVEESRIPVREDVRGACEILGLDPLYVANEGRLVAFVPASQVERAVAILRSHPQGNQAVAVGEVLATDRPRVTLKSPIGAVRILDLLSGEQLPRIC